MAELFIDSVNKEIERKYFPEENDDIFISELYCEIYERDFLRDGLRLSQPEASEDEISLQIEQFKGISPTN